LAIAWRLIGSCVTIARVPSPPTASTSPSSTSVVSTLSPCRPERQQLARLHLLDGGDAHLAAGSVSSPSASGIV